MTTGKAGKENEMETKEKPKDPNDPREYRPIPHGFWKLLAGTIATFVLLANCVWVGFQMLKWFADAPGELEIGISVIFMCATMLSIGIYATNGARGKWIDAYWLRNVRAYVVAHYTEGGRARCSDPFPRGHERLDVFLNAYPFVVLWPLGGWFSRPRAYWRAKQSWWSVARDTRFPGTPVKVTDKNGSSLQFATIGDAMTFIADRLECAAGQTFWHDSSDMPLSWLRVLEGLSEDRDDARRDREGIERRLTALFQPIHDTAGNPSVNGPMHEWLEREIRRLIAERDAARGEVDRYKDGFLPAAVKDRDAARHECEEAVKFVGGIADELEQTDRLAQTIEGLRILERIHGWLGPAFERMGDGHMQGQAQLKLAIVRAKLADKVKRDRRRHKKGATATT